MSRMTVNEASVRISELSNEKMCLLGLEAKNCIYSRVDNVKPDIPDYDYGQTRLKVAEIDSKIRAIQHAINRHNAKCTISVRRELLTIDEALILISQLNEEKVRVDNLRSRSPMKYNQEVSDGVSEYIVVNYSTCDAMNSYNDITLYINDIQKALDSSNNTVKFEVDI